MEELDLYFENLPKVEKSKIINDIFRDLEAINSSIVGNGELKIYDKKFKEAVAEYYDGVINFKKSNRKKSSIYEEYAYLIKAFIEKRPIGFSNKLKYRTTEILVILLALQNINRKNSCRKSLPKDFFSSLILFFIESSNIKSQNAIKSIALLLRAIYVDREF